MEQKAVLEAIVKALDSKRAEDIQVIGVKNQTILGDYFVISAKKISMKLSRKFFSKNGL